jgi:hypothetical protein
MELDQSMPSEDYSGETSASHYDNTLVAQRAVVPDNSVPEHQFTFLLLHQSVIALPSPTSIWPMTNSTWKLAVWNLSVQSTSNLI